MKPITLLATILLSTAIEASALNEVKSLQQWDADSAKFVREGDNLFGVDFRLDFDKLDVPSEEALLFTPVLYNGNDSLTLPAVGVYGRNRFFHYERRGTGMLSGADEKVLKNAEKPSYIDYNQIVSYQPWMNGAHLKVKAECYGCCFQLLGRNMKDLGYFMEPDFTIDPLYVYEPCDTVLYGELSGEARVQFVVDKWDVHYDKFGNGPELDKITHSIDTVAADPGLTITEIWLKGFASPEATWKHNTMLAKNRVEAVKNYVNRTRGIDQKLITTEFQPEDWAGLRKWVANSNIEHRDEILAIIDEPVTNPDKDWDAKDRKLGKLFPKQRKFLLENVYPPLRHTEYKIKYKVERIREPEKIREELYKHPGRLLLTDFNVAAKGLTPGSPEFNDVYDIMVRVYPDNELANLNAANAALQSGRLKDADKYLQKAGNIPAAEYSRGLLLLQQEKYQEAKPYIEAAVAQNIKGAQTVLDQLNAYIDYLSKMSK